MTPSPPPVALVVACLTLSIGLCTASVHDASAFILGQAFDPPALTYSRFPLAAKSVVRSEVYDLSLDSAGLFLSFTSNSSTFDFKYSLLSEDTTMWHFPSTGIAACDVYAFDTNTSHWRWITTSHPAYPVTKHSFSASASMRYIVHLPTYNAPITFNITIDDNATIHRDPLIRQQRPIVHYGTSITQGGVTSRPGLIFSNTYARLFNYSRTVYNFGFSGNGKMETNVGSFLVQLDMAALIVDCNWNMNGETIAEAVVPFVQYVRSHGHPTTPIVLTEGTRWGIAWRSPNMVAGQTAKRAALRAGFDQLIKGGDQNLYYVNGSSLSFPIIDMTVGGVHPADLGHKKMGDFWASFLPTILNASEPFLDPLSYRVAPQATASVAAAHSPSVVRLNREQLLKDEQTAALLSAAALAPQQPTQPHDDPIRYTDMQDLGILNRGFTNTPSPFNRLPVPAQSAVRPEVWSLGLFSTGLAVRFVSNSSELYINSTLVNPAAPLWHMCAAGTSGVDLYMWDDESDQWRHAGTPENIQQGPLAQALATSLPTDKLYSYLLYLPLRNEMAVGSMIGVPEDGVSYLGPMGVNDPAPAFKTPPIVWYGTSIQQGGVASRPGHEYDAIIGRTLNREIFNFGFAGNGEEEISVAEWLVEIKPAAFVMDCLWNIGLESEMNLTLPLYRYLREKLPVGTPIVMAAGTHQGNIWNDPSSQRPAQNAYLEQLYNKLHPTDKDLYFVSSESLYKNVGDIDVWPYVNPTVGGIHPGDLGQYAIAEFYTKFFTDLLG